MLFERCGFKFCLLSYFLILSLPYSWIRQQTLWEIPDFFKAYFRLCLWQICKKKRENRSLHISLGQCKTCSLNIITWSISSKCLRNKWPFVTQCSYTISSFRAFFGILLKTSSLILTSPNCIFLPSSLGRWPKCWVTYQPNSWLSGNYYLRQIILI